MSIYSIITPVTLLGRFPCSFEDISSSDVVVYSLENVIFNN